MATGIKKTGSVKHKLIDKANKRIVILTGAAGFILIFTIVGANTLIKQILYQDKVIDARGGALEVAKTNLSNTEQLVNQYNAFVSTPQNVIGGSSQGTSDGNGDNAQIIINALPSRYDFPALTSSLEYMVALSGLQLEGITATDDEIAQQTNNTSSTPAPIEIPFVLSATGSSAAIQSLVQSFQRSIRPFQVQSLSINVKDGDTTKIEITAKTFFQPAKNLNVREEPIQ